MERNKGKFVHAYPLLYCLQATMYKKTEEHVLDRLASVLGLKTHRELADRGKLKPVTIQSFRLGRRRLTGKAAKQIELNTGVSCTWLLAGDASEPVVDYRDRSYKSQDFHYEQREADT